MPGRLHLCFFSFSYVKYHCLQLFSGKKTNFIESFWALPKRNVMKKYLLLVFLLFWGLGTLHAQTLDWAWAKTVGGGQEEYFTKVATDSRNGVYGFGYFKSQFLQIGSNNFVNAGDSDLLVVKYDTLGNMLWAKAFGGSGADVPADISTDNAGDIVITGHYTGNLQFASFALPVSVDRNVFIAKLSAVNGDVLWAKGFAGNAHEAGQAVKCDKYNNIYTAGSFGGTSLTIDGNVLSSYGPNYTHGYYCKFDAAGNIKWAKRAWAWSYLRFTDINCYNNRNEVLLSVA